MIKDCSELQDYAFRSSILEDDMKNNTGSRIVIEIKHLDNANRLTSALNVFCNTAALGGDAEMFIKHNGTMKHCGFVAHNLVVKSVGNMMDGVVYCYGCKAKMTGDYCYCLRCRMIAIGKATVFAASVFTLLYILSNLQ